MAEELNIQDSWRERNLNEKQFTYYSGWHQSWSRIDMVWTTKELNSDIDDVVIDINTWADHNPIIIKWKEQKTTTRRWTLKKAILNQTEFKHKMEEQMRTFFQTNKKEETSTQNLWDMAKAVMRGTAIAYMANEYKKKRQYRKSLEEEYKKLESELQKNPQCRDLKQQLDLNKHKLNIIEKEEMAKK